ncbi:hypothetical protein PAMP_023889 [Pampus punctatissimus]
MLILYFCCRMNTPSRQLFLQHTRIVSRVCWTNATTAHQCRCWHRPLVESFKVEHVESGKNVH